MNRLEHLLTIGAEECAEVAQRISKALRFGLEEVQPGQLLDNAERIREEFTDLCATLQMIEEEAEVVLLPPLVKDPDAEAERNDKRAKVERFLLLSHRCGRLVEP